MPLRSHFDFLAPIYDRVIRLPEGDRLATAAALPTTGRLLDAGGGTGRIGQSLIGRARQIVVADASLRMLDQARAKAGLRLVACQAEHLPFRAAAFERIVMVDAYHHLEHQEDSLAELWRVLVPGGRLVIEEPDILRLSVRWVALVERLAQMRSRFVRAECIAESLTALGAAGSIFRDQHTAWVIGEKH
jgi:ubiquinone/menaquinone biosynthesis C-methylase UbiE